jgi:excinuclease UvrABC ATPase subunit
MRRSVPFNKPRSLTWTASQPASRKATANDGRKARGYEPGRFSFNVKGGRCEACQGDGVIKIEMHFLPDVYVTCDVCKGKRYNRETLEVLFKGKSIADVLDMTVAQGNTVVVIEHNLEVIKTADWVIDLGPEGGDGGGEIVVWGPPEDIVKAPRSYTGKFLGPVLAKAGGKRKRGTSEAAE